MIPLVQLGTNSPFDVPVFGGGVRIADLSGLTRVTVELAGVTIDSDLVHSGTIRWDVQDAGGDNVLRFILGGQAIPPGFHGARMTLYAPDFPDGKSSALAYPVEVTGDPDSAVLPDPPSTGTLVLYDTFTDDDETALTDHTADSGDTWADGPATHGVARCKIFGNSCISSAANGGGSNYVVGSAIGSTVRVEADLAFPLGGWETVAMSFYLRVEIGAPSNFVRVSIREQSGEIGARVIVDGVDKGYVPWDFTVGGRWDVKFEVRNETLNMWVDGVAQGSLADPSFASHLDESFLIQKAAISGSDPWTLHSLRVEKDL